MRNPESILITGASSGIGEALAEAYAKPGRHLFLSGRDQARLETVATTCRSLGATVEATVLDVTDAPAMRAWIEAANATRPLDLVIANAGISAGSGGEVRAEQQARAIFDINVTGVLNTLYPALSVMRPRGRGQIALMASMAAFRGMPSAPAYSASKAAVKALGEGLRGELADSGIAVNVVCPGFVESRITAANRFAMPMIMPAARAASIIQAGLAANRARIAFPWIMHVAMIIIAALPPFLSDRLVGRLPRKDT